MLAFSGRTVTFSAKPTGSKPWEGHVAAAQKKSHQWCLTLTPNNTETIERMTSLELTFLFLEKSEAVRYHPPWNRTIVSVSLVSTFDIKPDFS